MESNVYTYCHTLGIVDKNIINCWEIRFENYKLILLWKWFIKKTPDVPCWVLYQWSTGLTLVISWALLTCFVDRVSLSLCISFVEPKEGREILLFLNCPYFFIFVCMMSVHHNYLKWHICPVVIVSRIT